MNPYLYLLFLVVLFSNCRPKQVNQTTKVKATKASNDRTANLNQSNQTSKGWSIDKVKGSVISFTNGIKFNSNLYDLKYIGQVTNDSKAPFLILSGRDCTDCDANI